MAEYYKLDTSGRTLLPDGTPTLEAINKAEELLNGRIHTTHLDESRYIKEACEADVVWLKMENLQRTGSFKIRGAFNKIGRLTEGEKKRGIVAASAGNHAQGVAMAANEFNVPCTIVMPKSAPIAKVQATTDYATKKKPPKLYGDTFDQALQEAIRMKREDGLTFIHAFDDPYVIAGQGTIGLEILKDAPDVDTILVPVGGGGLISGIALAVKSKHPLIQIIGVQAEGCASALSALQMGRIITFHDPTTIADGIRVGKIGELPFAIMRRYIDGMITVKEEEIVNAMFILQERCKLVVEAAGAVCVAALMCIKREPLFKGKRVVAVLSGGNVDMDRVGGVIEAGLSQENRTAVIKVTMKSIPGTLHELTGLINDLGAEIRHINQPHILRRLPDHQVDLVMTLGTRNREHKELMKKELEKHEYKIEEIFDPYASLI